ncbi:Hsp20/alpha crystallin family protein [Fulvivirga sediminis]|uniref:Hsp20/alpha crystallin family protein n=1 Tax=Fulvivirga sediminis TaxID=2803949 RepID=A0A937F1T4_9BACT|nr:Hsp20/alpha crystallin family protein [Fulvivirga sediminis]MBL3654722.1 Hsp20/alpha crystallin family protein [Fulvivirga sediminis]
MTLIRRTNDLFPTFFDDFLSRDMFNFSGSNATMPAVNIKESESDFQVEVAAPGANKKDFKVEVDNNLLTISYEKEVKNEEKNDEGKFTKREFNYQSFQRSFTLPSTVLGDKIEAKYTDGILALSIPKKEEAKTATSRLIEIS